MNGDFTRITFRPERHYRSVLMQQGRVQLDADWNEQAAILLHYLQTLAADLIGPFGGPEGTGFNIQRLSSETTGTPSDYKIGGGHYYVDGILCENEAWTDEEGNDHPTYYGQPDYSSDSESDQFPTGNFLFYLDVWERLVTSYEDSHLREVALGGPDTAARVKTVWQVRHGAEMPDGTPISSNDFNQNDWKRWVKDHWTDFNIWQPANRGMLKAKAKEDTAENPDACAVPPGARYRGTENQLYRVEIHHAGVAGNATFKWSRDNGSVVFPIRELNGTTAYLDHLGRDERSSLKQGDWVEVIDNRIAGQYDFDSPGQLARVETVNLLDMTVTLKTIGDAPLPAYSENGAGYPFLRRWDYRRRESTETSVPKPAEDGALLIVEDTWLTLENGVQIYFDSSFRRDTNSDHDHFYGTGDYWTIAARTETGDVEWLPETDDQGEVILDSNGNQSPASLPPHGVTHHYAPLAIVLGAEIIDVRNVFCPVQPCPPSNTARVKKRG